MSALSTEIKERKSIELEDRVSVFTIGHSTLTLESFLGLLKKADITAVADVRSSPFSRRLPHFNRDELRIALKGVDIKYVFLGKELGGRPRTSDLYCDGIADYEKMALQSDFLKGIERVAEGSIEYKIALMCSEQNPLDCHRCLLVGRALAKQQVSVKHILGNGTIIDQHKIEERLLAMSSSARADIHDMFVACDDLLAIAYRSRARTVAYREPVIERMQSQSSNWPDYAS